MLLRLPRTVRILLAREPVDMRKSIDGLAAVVRMAWQEDLYAGHLFVFVSRRGDRVKVLSWDAGGFVLTYTRLEKGRFKVPTIGEELLGAQLDATQLSMLLDGLDVTHVRRPARWAPPESVEKVSTGQLVSPERWQKIPRRRTGATGEREPSGSRLRTPTSGSVSPDSKPSLLSSSVPFSASGARRWRASRTSSGSRQVTAPGRGPRR